MFWNLKLVVLVIHPMKTTIIKMKRRKKKKERNNEYLVYHEHQHRIRYVLEFEIGSTGNSSDEDDDY